ncbi:MAG: PhnD/SsuA/transferrin family substrate-binding protein [Chloroflexota bacterium]
MTELFACSRMYNVSPEVTAAWDALYAYLVEQTGIPLNVIYHAFPEPIEELWQRPLMGPTLMCGYPYIRAQPRPKLIAAPVPSPAHYHGRSVYFSHLLVAEDSPFQTIEDTFGHRLSWTIENSQSGYNAIRSFLLQFQSEERPLLYKDSIGPIGTFTVGVEGIRNNEIDVVPIDSFSYDLMSKYAPEKLAGTRIIATTPASPFPPLVAGHDVPDATVEEFKTAVFHAHTAPELKEAFDTMMITRFTAVTPDDYQFMRQQERDALLANYPMPS